MSTTVLVVEDDTEINELLGEYLALENIQYLAAATGQEGIHQAISHHPDAVILDLMLPDIDGFEVARTLSAHRATYDIPIIILSCMCQECDREKGFGAGALFYMNKPFLPDDLLSTLKRALEWKAALGDRPPVGAVQLGGREATLCSKAANQMFADLFARTDLSDGAMAQVHEVVDTLALWARQWNQNHGSDTQLRLDYKIGAGADGSQEIEWKLSENAPGMLADAFFKPVAAGTGGLMGWGGSTLVAKQLVANVLPAAWMHVLAKTGAARFEKDSKARTVRFARTLGAGAAGTGNSHVPVVEIDGARYPTRLRDEALACKRK